MEDPKDCNLDLAHLFFDDDEPSMQVGKGGGRQCVEWSAPPLSSFSSVSSQKKSVLGSLVNSHDIESDVTFDNWLSRDVSMEIWARHSIGTGELDSIANPLHTQEYLWKIFESVNTNDLSHSTPPQTTPSQPVKESFISYFRRKLSFSCKLHATRWLCGKGISRKDSPSLPKKLASPELRSKKTTNSKNSNKGSGLVFGGKHRAPEKRRLGHSCGVKE